MLPNTNRKPFGWLTPKRIGEQWVRRQLKWFRILLTAGAVITLWFALRMPPNLQPVPVFLYAALILIVVYIVRWIEYRG